MSAPPTAPSGNYGRAAVTIRFPQSSAFNVARVLVARANILVNGLNRRWGVELALHQGGRMRRPPKTLTPRTRVKPPPLQPTVHEVIEHFSRGRNMFTMTPDLRTLLATQAIGRFVADALRGQDVAPQRIIEEIARGYHRAVVFRWEHGGNDLHLRALSPRYVGYKLRLGYPATIGNLTGQSLAAIRGAALRVRQM